MKVHVETVHERKRHHCHLCEDHFAYKSDLLKHFLRIHKGEGKPYKPRVKRIGRIAQWSDFRNLKIKKCSYCLAKQKGNPYKKEYKINPRKNVNELLTFEELDESIGTICTCAELNQEDLIHVGKKLKCSSCDYVTKRSAHLKKHVEAVHEGIRYDCTICNDVSFTQKQQLTKHIESVHEGKKTEGKVFKQKTNEGLNKFLKKHMASANEEKKPDKYPSKKHVENESFNEKEVETTKKLKKELTENGFILCEKETCKMGCLSIAGFRSHQNKCTGFMKDGVSYTFFLFCFIYKKVKFDSSGSPRTQKISM